ncbi:MAG: hypothetical protein H6Q66_2544 [Firmicutes bacterium]|nr:hypothetical protein [Bacillota bacterium]
MQRGFIMIEMLAVMTVIFILSAVTVPMITKTLARQDIDGAARNLAADIRWIQQISINGGVGAGATVYVLMFNNADHENYYITANGQTIKAVQLPGSVRLGNAPSQIMFNPNTGFPSTGAQSIKLQSLVLNNCKYVILAPAIGRVRISVTDAVM